jgi:DNA-binding CsgD family transcriptional regulator
MTHARVSEAQPTSDDGEKDRALRLLLALVLGVTIVGGGVDLVLDAPESWRSPHALFESTLIVAALASAGVLWAGWWRSRRALADTEHALAERSAERDAWRASAEAALAGFGKAIDERFSAWGLTPVEREIAMLLLQGHSHKHIAFATGRSERTIRQHAVAVYQKSGLKGRAELAAFFLDDILLPPQPH